MKYAVIRINGRQYKVEEGKELLVDHAPSGLADAEVLLRVDDDKVSIGEPTLSKAKVTLKVVGEEKGDKVDVFKYKAKSRYRKHIGFRPQYMRVLVEKIA